jgi:sigma-B regulation protein RsbQ
VEFKRFKKRGGGLIVAAALLCLTSCASVEEAPPSATFEVNGLSLALDDRQAEEPIPAAPTLVFLHGWACDRSFWGELPARLGVDHRVVSLDLPGHGQSGTERENWSILGLGTDVRDLCDILALDDIVLVGHSMGAPVALAAAGQMVGRVRAVIAVDSLHNMTAPVPQDLLDPLIGSFESDWNETMQVAIATMVPGGAGSDLARWITARATQTDQTAALGLMRSFGGLDLAQLAREAAVPVRAINAAPYAGGAETLREENRALVDFDVILIGDVGHYLQLERPDLVEQGLRTVLAEMEAARQ